MNLYFCGCHKLLRNSINMSYYNIFFFIFFFFCCLITVSMADDHDQVAVLQQQNPLHQILSSRKDLVQIAGYGEEKLSTVLITGSVHCEEACSLSDDHEHQAHQLHLHAWPVSGAVVSVNCRVGGRKRKSSRSQGVTDEYGDFMIDLPSDLHAVPNLDKLCCARVIRVPKNTQCKAAFVKRHKGLKLSSVGNGIRTYSTGRIRFQNLTPKPSQSCIEKASNNKQM
ncbi:uncharacterized protein LOC126787651 [Argentina anserina]|uniref:uncharacterized protein LOC126787651 n=1 Tax=Argentina anserina TaxID=57926 RepID=UPI0021768688|nr:uncharacterized protein LOC126787651 [Potentilla anserina]